MNTTPKPLPELVAAALAITTDTPENVQSAVESVIAFYREAGFIIRVEQVSPPPFRMGNHYDVVTVSARRVPA